MNKKGMTLVELLAVITVLAIILIIAVPQIGNVIKSGRLNSFKDSALLIAKNAQREYMTQKTTNKDFDPNNMNCDNLANLSDDYGYCNVSFDSEGVATVTLAGTNSGKFNDMKCVGTLEDINCNIEQLDMVEVTFDLDGGTSPISSKKVLIGSNYGYLPTPTKEGYTFLGWNGKNLFNIDDFMDFYSPYQNTQPKKVEFEGEEVWKMYGHVNVDGRNLKYMEGKFKEKTSYTFSLDIYDVRLNNYYGIHIYVRYKNDSSSIALPIHLTENEWHHVNFTSRVNDTIECIYVSYGTGDAYSYIKNFQIEEGTNETAYEPYYIESNTKVVQRQNHTLKAIWEPNS